MISKAINKILPDEILYLIVDYIKPDKLDDKIQSEIKTEFVFRLFTQNFKDYIIDVDEIEKNNKPKNNYHFEYYVMCLPPENYSFYIEQLKKHKNKEMSNYFIKAIEWVIGFDQQRGFYDDDNYDYNDEDEYIQAHNPIVFHDYDSNYEYMSEYDMEYYIDEQYND